MSSPSSSSSKNNNVGITAFRRNIEPTETLAGLCIKYNIAMADIHRANNGTLVNENTAHAKGWVMIPYFDRDGKKINNDSEKKPSSSSSEKAIDKLRRHYQLPGTPEKGTTTKTKTKTNAGADDDEKEAQKEIEVIDTIRYEYKPAEKKGEYGKSETKTRKKEREKEKENDVKSNSNDASQKSQHATVANGYGPSSMFARDKPLFTPHKEKPAAAAEAITMEGTGIRAAMKYKSKTLFSKLKSKALHLTADLREEKRAASPNFRESLNDIRGPPPKGKGD
ncbi:unnamed protein product [Bathycoccus prasinos]